MPARRTVAGSKSDMRKVGLDVRGYRPPIEWRLCGRLVNNRVLTNFRGQSLFAASLWKRAVITEDNSPSGNTSCRCAVLLG
jgi:hypothetical protein